MGDTNFIEEIIAFDARTRRFNGRINTRFPPEPNGYLHIGHAKSIVLNAGLARRNGGHFNLRFDDTNPVREAQEYVESIIRDVEWLVGDLGGRIFYASDYFPQMYALAEKLIAAGEAYVCDLPPEEMRAYRGTLTEPGRDSPFRSRTAAENLELFHRMKAGDFPQGSKTLRAKIDNQSGNLNLRDPVMYRILDAPHHRQGDAWRIYPSYDWAHGIEDSLEGITHSLCTLEFENHRPLYDWFLDKLSVHHPRQVEFAKLQLTHTVLSKRNLLLLVTQKHVWGWDDPRLATIAGMRRRGYPASAVRDFCEEVGITKLESVVEFERLENAVRATLNEETPRRMAVLRPLKVVITNYPAGKSETVEVPNHPDNAQLGVRQVPFGRELYIEVDDFAETPPKGYFRLVPGGEVRLRSAYFIRCTDVRKNTAGEVTEVHCTYDPASRGGVSPDGRKVKGTLHWVPLTQAIDAEVRLFDRLFLTPHPGRGREGDNAFLADLNTDSLKLVNAKLEPALRDARPGDRFQFERLGYFAADSDVVGGTPAFNRIVALKDAWAKATRPAPQASKKHPAAAPVRTSLATPDSAVSKVAAEKPHLAAAILSDEEFAAFHFRAARVLTAERVPKSDKLLVLTADIGEPAPRQIVAGLGKHYEPASLVGTNLVVLANLAPKKFLGIESKGMVLAASHDGVLSVLDPGPVAPGTLVR